MKSGIFVILTYIHAMIAKKKLKFGVKTLESWHEL